MKNLIFAFFIIFFAVTATFCGPNIGQSSVVTLAFPWGARSAALGETFTGIADDEQALFYNPAGLGLSPLSKTWQHYSPTKEPKFIALSGGMRNQRDVWALNNQNEIYRFNGVDWVNYSIHNVDTTETFADIAIKYTSFETNEKIDAAILEIKKFNNLYPRERRRISAILVKKMPAVQADSLAEFFAFLSYAEQSRSNIKSYLLEFYETSEVDAAVSGIVTILGKISGLSGIYDLRIPYTLGLFGRINDIECDATGRLWVAGDSGLWRFENEWKKFAAFDGVPKDISFNSLTSMLSGDIAIATSAGAYLFENGIFKKVAGELIVGDDTVTHKDTVITAKDTIVNITYRDTTIDGIDTAFEIGADTTFIFDTTFVADTIRNNLFDGKITYINKIENNVYLGTESGLLVVLPNGLVSLIDSTRLVSNVVRVVKVDERKRIWVGGDEGVTLFNGIEWKKFRFTNSKVFDIAAESDRRIWFATDNGAVEYFEARDGTPDWKVHHERNNLNSSLVTSAIFHRNDIWLATGNGISRFQHGEVRATVFFEQLLPSLHLNDMWHAAVAGTVPLGEFGTIGIFMNFLNFGGIEAFRPDGTSDGVYSAYELVGGVGYGMRLRKDFALGLNLKYFYSRLMEGEAEVQSFAVDAGLIKNNLFTDNLSLGFSLLNMGPAVQYSEDTGKNAIPFTMRLGTSYKPIRRATHYLLWALDLEREIVYLDPNDSYQPVPFFKAIWKDLFDDDQESWRDEFSKITIHTGLEFNYLDFISPRVGWMYDKAGSRNEVNLGMGLNINMISADFGIIFALGDNDVRQSQMRFSITYVR
jgi:hypothetical protein